MRMIILTLIMVVVAVAVTVVDVAAGAAWHVTMVGARGSFGRR